MRSLIQVLFLLLILNVKQLQAKSLILIVHIILMWQVSILILMLLQSLIIQLNGMHIPQLLLQIKRLLVPKPVIQAAPTVKDANLLLSGALLLMH